MKLLDIIEGARIPFHHTFEDNMSKKGYPVVRLDKLYYEVKDKIKFRILRVQAKLKVYDMNGKLIQNFTIKNDMDAIRKLLKILRKM